MGGDDEKETKGEGGGADLVVDLGRTKRRKPEEKTRRKREKRPMGEGEEGRGEGKERGEEPGAEPQARPLEWGSLRQPGKKSHRP